MLKDPFWAVRREAVLQAEQIASKSDSLKDPLKAALLLATKDVRSEGRAPAVRALRYYRGYDVLGVINSALFDSTYTVISNALGSLAKADSAYAEPKVAEFLKYPSHQDRVAATALSVLGSLDSTAAVTAACKNTGPDKETGMRYSALSVLRRYGRGRPDALNALKNVLGEPIHSGANYFAIQALGEIGDDSVIPALEVATKDPETQFSNAAKQSIEKIRKRTETKKE